MKEKVCLVTGANSGIGKEVVRGLAIEGCTVVMACRDEIKGIPVKDELIQATGNPNIFLLRCDVSSQRSIRVFHQTFLSQFDRLDVLVHNAAMLPGLRLLSPEQVEMQFATNYLGPFLLTGLFLDLMLKTGDARIINLGSRKHFKGRIDFSQLPVISKGRYTLGAAYAQSKLALLLFTYQLARLTKDTSLAVNCINPGKVNTGFGEKYTQGSIRVGWKLVKRFLKSPAVAARPILDLALSPEYAGVTGKYFEMEKPAKSSKDSYDEELEKRLWKSSEQWTGYPYDAFLANSKPSKGSIPVHV